jgi:hypothetical protein
MRLMERMIVDMQVLNYQQLLNLAVLYEWRIEPCIIEKHLRIT